MAFSFPNLAFVRVVQLVRRICRAQDDLAIEVVMLRHEVAVLRLKGPRTRCRRCVEALPGPRSVGAADGTSAL